MYYIVDEGFEVAYNGAWLALFLGLMSYVYFVAFMPIGVSTVLSTSESESVDRKRSSLGNALFVLVVFALYLIWYDPSKTFKPTWTDILG